MEVSPASPSESQTCPESETINGKKIAWLTEEVPRQEYEEAPLQSLAPGLRRIKFTARVVNIHDQPVKNHSRKAAKGCLKLLVQDGSAALIANLWYSTESYASLHLGSLVTIWTTHITSTMASIVQDVQQIQPAAILTSLFPEKDAGCYIQIHDPDKQNHLYRIPLNYVHGRGIEGLLSLRSFVEGAGKEIAEAKLLVYVKAIGRPTSYSSPNSKYNSATSIMNIGIADAEEPTTEAVLSFFAPHLINTALMNFVPYRTVLLISYPAWRTGHKISIRARTQIDIDPCIPQATELRQWAWRWNRPANEHVDRDDFKYLLPPKAPPPLRHTLASLSRSIQNNPDSSQVAYIPIILSSINIIPLLQKKQLFCLPCPQSQPRRRRLQTTTTTPGPDRCQFPFKCPSKSPLYGLHPSTTSLLAPTPHTCHTCHTTPVILRLSPLIVGPLHDETGTLSSASQTFSASTKPHRTSTNPQPDNRRPLPPLLWTDRAYTSLLGRPPSEIGRLALTAAQSSSTDVDAHTALPNPNSKLPDQQMAREGRKQLQLLQHLQHRLQWMRIILLVGWTGSGSASCAGSMSLEHGHRYAKKAQDEMVVQDGDGGRGGGGGDSHETDHEQKNNGREEEQEHGEEGRLLVLDVVG